MWIEYTLFLVYWLAGYWAYGVVFYEGKIVFAQPGQIFTTKLVQGLIFGWLWIPVALIKKFFRMR